jgi:hypothetical protein
MGGVGEQEDIEMVGKRGGDVEAVFVDDERRWAAGEWDCGDGRKVGEIDDVEGGGFVAEDVKVVLVEEGAGRTGNSEAAGFGAGREIDEDDGIAEGVSESHEPVAVGDGGDVAGGGRDGLFEGELMGGRDCDNGQPGGVTERDIGAAGGGVEGEVDAGFG